MLDLYALRLCDGLEEYLRSRLSKQDETSHELGEAPHAAVPHHLEQFYSGCFLSSRFESSRLFKLFHKCSSTSHLYSFLLGSILMHRCPPVETMTGGSRGSMMSPKTSNLLTEEEGQLVLGAVQQLKEMSEIGGGVMK